MIKYIWKWFYMTILHIVFAPFIEADYIIQDIKLEKRIKKLKDCGGKHYD